MLDELYQQVILDHYRSPRGRGHLANPTLKGEGANPLCGDEVVLELLLEGDRIIDLRFDGKGCSISQASASMLVESLKGKTVAEAEATFEQVMKLLRGEVEPDPATMGDFCALAGVRKFPVRVKCAALPWHALEEALKQL